MVKKSNHKRNLKLWSCYNVKFFDHCRGHDELLECEIVGWLTKDNEKSYVFSHWIVSNDHDARNDNLELTTIAKELIISIRKLF